MRWISPVFMLALAGCALPGRLTLAPNPVPPDAQSIAATKAFEGRIPLVSIQPGTADYAAPLQHAVAAALAIKPDAAFEVRAVAPVSAGPDAGAAQLAELAPLADGVARAVAADGVQPGHVTLTAGTSGDAAEVLVYVK